MGRGALLVAAAWATLACGRSEQRPALRIDSVTSVSAEIRSGAAGLLIYVNVVNDSEQPASLQSCELAYRGAGGGFSARLVMPLSTIEARRSLSLVYSVRVPFAAGEAEIDATVQVQHEGKSYALDGAERPLRWTFGSSTDPDFGDLAELLVNRRDDELDGGDALTSVAGAGGVDDISIREALTIIHNTGIPAIVRFEPALFMADVTGPIELAVDSLLPPLDVPGTVIDGRGLAVRITNNDTEAGPIRISAPRVKLFGIDVAEGIIATQADDLWIFDTRLSLGPQSTGVNIQNSERVVLEEVILDTGNTSHSLSCLSCPDLTVIGGFASGSMSLSGDRIALYQASLSGLTISGTDLYASQSSFSRSYYTNALTLTSGVQGALIEDCVVNSNDLVGVVVAGAQRVSLRRTLYLTSDPTPQVMIGLQGLANNSILAPVLSQASRNRVSGTTTAPDGSEVELFTGSSVQLEIYVGKTAVAGGTFAFSTLALTPGTVAKAIVTDPQGNSSAVSAGLTVVE